MKQTLTRVLAACLASSCMALSAQAAPTTDEPTPKGLTLKGDIRFRHEYQNDEGATGDNPFQQQRLMMRLGAVAQPAPDIEGEVRLGSGYGRTSLNQTLGKDNVSASGSGGLGNFTLTLDRAYFDWGLASGAHLFAGRRRNIFYSAGSDLIWDGDLNFDGLAATYGADLGDLKLTALLSYDWIRKDAASAAVKDNQLITGQLAARQKFGDLEAGLGATLYHYTHLAGQSAIDTGNFKGNSSFSSGGSSGGSTGYRYDFNILDFSAEIGAPVGGQTLAAVFDYARNAAAPDEQAAWLAGLKYGRVKKQGDWLVQYDYRVVGRDAVVGAFADGDVASSGGADIRNHRVRAAYGLNDALIFTASAYLGSRGIAADETALDRKKVQLDLTFGF
jgi:hypothetical protein